MATLILLLPLQVNSRWSHNWRFTLKRPLLSSLCQAVDYKYQSQFLPQLDLPRPPSHSLLWPRSSFATLCGGPFSRLILGTFVVHLWRWYWSFQGDERGLEGQCDVDPSFSPWCHRMWFGIGLPRLTWRIHRYFQWFSSLARHLSLPSFPWTGRIPSAHEPTLLDAPFWIIQVYLALGISHFLVTCPCIAFFRRRWPWFCQARSCCRELPRLASYICNQARLRLAKPDYRSSWEWSKYSVSTFQAQIPLSHSSWDPGKRALVNGLCPRFCRSYCAKGWASVI